MLILSVLLVGCGGQEAIIQHQPDCGNVRCAAFPPELLYKGTTFLPSPERLEEAQVLIWNQVYEMDSKPPAAHFSPPNCLNGWGATYGGAGGKYPCIGGISTPGGDAYAVWRGEHIHNTDMAHEYLHLMQWEKYHIQDNKHEGIDWTSQGLLGKAILAELDAGL